MRLAPPDDNPDDQPHLVSLVLQSKKALQHGEQLCTRASTLSLDSAQTAVDVLALDAKIRWLSDVVLEQLKLAASVAKSIELKRSQLEKRANEWDSLRTQRTSELDFMLNSLGSQLVPPEFHTVSAASSLFGSPQNSDDEHEQEKDNHSVDPDTPFTNEGGVAISPTETLRNVLTNGIKRGQNKRKRLSSDRSKWKSLRDFIDERAVEDVVDTLESDWNVLDDILARTSDYPEQLANTIASIRSTIPQQLDPPPIDSIMTSQESVSSEMARHLESLAGHYGQMSDALRDSENGVIFAEDDIQDMNRDTDELPAIIADLERNITSIEGSYEQLCASKRQYEEHLSVHRKIVDDLDELGDIISEMLERQQNVENETSEHLTMLYVNLSAIEDLYERFKMFQYSYSKLLIEMARRRQYKEAAQKIVEGMMNQLEAMTEEERHLRETFNEEHGDHLPSDVCLPIQNPPTRWEVLPLNHESVEILPLVAPDLLEDAVKKIQSMETQGIGIGIQSGSVGLSASQSL
ncbi:autophagy protein Apg17-domain-containing protein [Abortiporus biennis]|nr:autophagy protein Apg17-domain-containing protein [Abortiporus biennis]